jgi:hypothetical protein
VALSNRASNQGNRAPVRRVVIGSVSILNAWYRLVADDGFQGAQIDRFTDTRFQSLCGRVLARREPLEYVRRIVRPSNLRMHQPDGSVVLSP